MLKEEQKVIDELRQRIYAQYGGKGTLKKLAEDCRPTYPDQNTGEHYTERQLLNARRKSDHPEEPSWGIYEVSGAVAVFADCDVAHVEGIQCN